MDWSKIVDEHRKRLSLADEANIESRCVAPVFEQTLTGGSLLENNFPLSTGSLEAPLFQNSGGGLLPYAVSPTILDCTAFHQRLLEDAVRRNLLSQATSSDTLLVNILERLGVMHRSHVQQMLSSHQGSTIRQSRMAAIMTKPERMNAPLRGNTGTKAKFPLPGSTGSGRKPRISKLCLFQKMWAVLHDGSEGIADQNLKKAFAKEIFARWITRADSGHLYRRMHGLDTFSLGASGKRRKISGGVAVKSTKSSR
jgi:hypothetical protein